MYPVGIEKFEEHNSSKTKDVQVLYNVKSEELSHAICIFYQPSNQKVLVYDSLMKNKLEPRQKEIISQLYPFKTDIVFMKPKTIQGYTHQTDAVFAMIYATMLLLGNDPCNHDFKLNTVSGDETLYMRLHILNMFANRKLSLMKNEHKIHTIISKIAGSSCINPKVK